MTPSKKDEIGELIRTKKRKQETPKIKQESIDSISEKLDSNPSFN